jgi:UDP-N-acetylglucosamine 2-epimerase (non-hydrolysing)
MLDQVLAAFSIKPEVDLNLMEPNQSLSRLTARSIEAIDRFLSADRPDLVLVQGDTTTVFCAALAAFYHRVPVGHVEAGLRTGNLQAPWPEEANRVLTTRLTALHFAPTETSRQNLLREGVAPESIFVTGNTVIDALLLAVEQVRARPPAIPELPDFLQPGTSSETGPRMVLITGHRRENFGGGFESICAAIAALAGRFPEVQSSALPGRGTSISFLPNPICPLSACSPALPSSSPIPAGSRRRRQAWGNRCWLCATRPSGRKRSKRAP